ncbi:MAG: SPOR domain-containing protein [Pseudomonadota bacterium]
MTNRIRPEDIRRIISDAAPSDPYEPPAKGQTEETAEPPRRTPIYASRPEQEPLETAGPRKYGQPPLAGLAAPQPADPAPEPEEQLWQEPELQPEPDVAPQRAGDDYWQEGDFADPDSAEEDEERPRRRWFFPLLVAFVALLAFAGVLYYAFMSGGPIGGQQAPVLQAQVEADKIKPSEPGGLEVPNRDVQVLNQAPSLPEVDSVVLQPPPEEPAPLPPPPAAEAAAVTPEAATTGPLADPSSVVITPPDEIASLIESATPGRLAAPALAIPPRPQAKLEGRDATVSLSAGDSQTAAAEPAPAAPQPAPQPEPPAAAEPATPAPATTGGGGGFRVQLAALTSVAGANQTWERIRSDHGSLLGQLQPSVQRADLGERGIFYRLRAGPLPSRAAATQLCENLKAAGQACLVVAP